MNMPTPEHQSYVPISAGAQLRAYRENAQLTVDDVAHHLKLARRQVLAIENDELDALPGPTFVRGFIRNYARLLRIDPTPLLEASNLITPSSASIERIAPSMGELPASPTGAGSWTRWVIPFGLVLVLVAGIAFYEFGGVSSGMRKARKDPTEVGVSLPSTPGANSAPPTLETDSASATTSPGPTMQSGTGAAASSPSATVAQAAGPDVATAPADLKSTQRPDAQSAASTGTVDLSLSGASWIEIRDARGEMLLSRTLPGNARQSITGTLPLSVKIGNARAVHLQFNGSPIELAPYTQREVARLTLPLPRR